MNLLDISLSEEQEMLLRTARDFFKNECPYSLVREMEASERGYSPEQWKRMAELGWIGLMFPEQYGGEGCSLVEMMLLYAEMGRVLFPSPHFSTVALGGLTILEAGSEEQKRAFLPRIAKGDLIMGLAQVEATNTWDAEGVTLRALRRGSDYVLEGTKLLVLNAHVADWLVVVARTAWDRPAEESISLFLVDARSPGLIVTHTPNIAGAKLNAVEFRDVIVPATAILGRPNQGWAPLQRALKKAMVLQCAEASGASERVQEFSTDYAKERVQYGQPIGVHQSIQWKCVDMLKLASGARVLTLTAAAALTDDEPGDLEAAMAKAYASQAARFCAYEGHQIFCGAGQIVDHHLQLYSRRLKALELSLGDGDYHLDRVAEAMGL